MNRTIEYWFNLIMAEKTGFATLNGLLPNPDNYQTFLSDFKSGSKVSRWRLIVWCMAVAIFTLDALMAVFRVDILTLISQAKYGTLPWYPAMAKEFQYGDTLVWNGREYAYAVLDPTKQIIKRASAHKAPGIVTLKIAKDVAGVNTKLTPTEEVQARLYFDKRMPPGLTLNVINTDPDEVKLAVKIYVDPNLCDSATGELLSAPGTFPAEEAAHEYIRSLNDAFDGKFELDKLLNAIQAAVGTTDAYMISASGRYAANPFVAFAEEYQPYSGHLKVATGFDLNTTFVYLANV